MKCAILLLILCGSQVAIAKGVGLEARCWHSDHSCTVNPHADTPGTPDCEEHWFDQRLDHFNFRTNQSFQQRYFTYSKFWQPGGPVFFYCGNEASVELYVNATGLMWESAQQFGALLVFAEHRYYGNSLPFGQDSFTSHNLQWLTMEQALADYAHLIASMAWEPAVAFGGSYGGMLAAWLRMKYPSAVVGSIAASAPILAFQGLPKGYPAWAQGERYWQIVTADATEQAGAAPNCAHNIRQVWPILFKLGATEQGRATLTKHFKLCRPLVSEEQVQDLALMHLNAFDSMAMGNFPYPSNYLIYQQTKDPSLKLPAFPVREACKHLQGPFSTEEELFEALADASGVFYNASSVDCYSLPDDPEFDGIWDYQWCTEMLPQETYFTRDGVNDMFWPSTMNMTSINNHCNSTLGVVPRPRWIAEEFGGATQATNIVFSNGEFDPWRSGGVTWNISDSVIAVEISEGAHHLDLMFSNQQDPSSVRRAREIELDAIRGWLGHTAL